MLLEADNRFQLVIDEKLSCKLKGSFLVLYQKKKFIVQSIKAPVGLSDSRRDNVSNVQKDLGEQKLRVAFSTMEPPSPIPEGSEEECSFMASELDRKNYISSFFDSASTIAEEGRESLSEDNGLAGIVIL